MIFLLGGARSGKSAMAVRLALDSGKPVTFIATAAAGDDEMAERISHHRETRPLGWRTIEVPVDLLGTMRSADLEDFVIIDCLTLWVSNLLGRGISVMEIVGMAGELAAIVQYRDCVIVSNEVGLGIVPANDLARAFRDILGGVNAQFASRAERAILMVAGLAVDLARVDKTVGPR